MNGDPQKRKALYEALSADGYALGTMEEFSAKLDSPEKVRALYDGITADGYDVGDFNTFSAKVGPSPAAPFVSAPSAPPSGAGGASSAGIPRPAPTASPSMQAGGAPASASGRRIEPFRGEMAAERNPEMIPGALKGQATAPIQQPPPARLTDSEKTQIESRINALRNDFTPGMVEEKRRLRKMLAKDAELDVAPERQGRGTPAENRAYSMFQTMDLPMVQEYIQRKVPAAIAELRKTESVLSHDIQDLERRRNQVEQLGLQAQAMGTEDAYRQYEAEVNRYNATVGLVRKQQEQAKGMLDSMRADAKHAMLREHEIKSSQGSWLGAMYNRALDGVGQAVSGFNTLLMEPIMLIDPPKVESGETQEQAKNRVRKDIREAMRAAPKEMVGSESTTEEYTRALEDRSLLASALLGVAGTVPVAFMGPGGMGLMLQASDNTMQEMEGEDFASIPEWKKQAFSSAVGAIVGQLEKAGFRDAVTGGRIARSILGNAMAKAPAGSSAEALKRLIAAETDSYIANVASRTLGAGASEAWTEGLQAVAEYGAKDIFNMIEEKSLMPDRREGAKPGFETPDGLSEYAKDVVKQMAAGAIGGAVMRSPAEVRDLMRRGLGKSMTDTDFSALEGMLKDDGIAEVTATALDKDVEDGAMTKADADAAKLSWKEAREIVESIPPDIPIDKRREAFDLLAEKRRMSKMDKALVGDRVLKIDEKLAALVGERKAEEAAAKPEPAATEERVVEEAPIAEEAAAETVAEEVAVAAEEQPVTQPLAEEAITPQTDAVQERQAEGLPLREEAGGGQEVRAAQQGPAAAPAEEGQVARRNVRDVSLTLSEADVAIIKKTPSFRRMLSERQIANLKPGTNVLSLNQTAYGNIKRTFGDKVTEGQVAPLPAAAQPEGPVRPEGKPKKPKKKEDERAVDAGAKSPAAPRAAAAPPAEQAAPGVQAKAEGEVAPATETQEQDEQATADDSRVRKAKATDQLQQEVREDVSTDGATTGIRVTDAVEAKVQPDRTDDAYRTPDDKTKSLWLITGSKGLSDRGEIVERFHGTEKEMRSHVHDLSSKNSEKTRWEVRTSLSPDNSSEMNQRGDRWSFWDSYKPSDKGKKWWLDTPRDKYGNPRKPTPQPQVEEKPKEEAPKKGWKREGAKPVERPTAISDPDSKTRVEYSIPGFEDIPIVAVKAEGGWRSAIRVGDTDMLLGDRKSAEGMPSFAAAHAWRVLEKHGREKVEEIVQKKIKESEDLASRIERAADELEQKLKGMAGAFPLPPQIIVGAMRAAAKVIRGAGSVANAVKEAIAYIRATDWYKKLSDTEKGSAEQEVRKQVRIALEPREPKKPSPSEVKKAAEKDTVKREQQKVTRTEMAALKDQIRAVASGARGAIADVAKARKAFVEQIKEALSKDNLKGALTEAQARSITARAASVNPLNPKAVDRFIAYAEKVVEKANYAADIEAAENARARARKLSKGERVPANLKEVLDRFASVDVDSLSDPAKYAEMAQDFMAAFAPKGSAAYKMADAEAAMRYLDNIEAEWLKSYEKTLIDEYGIDDLDGVNAKDLLDAIESGTIDEFAESLENAKAAALKDRMVRVAEYARMGMGDIDTSWMRPENRRIHKMMMDVNLSMMSPQQLADFTFVADNIAINQSFDGSGRVASAVEAAIVAKDTAAVTSKYGIRTDWPVFGFSIGGKTFDAYRIWRQMMHATPNGMVRLMGFTKAMGDLSAALGIADIIKAKSSVDQEVRRIGDALDRFIQHQAQKAKRNGRSIESPEARFMEGIVGVAIQRRPGLTDMESLEQQKSLIQQDIEANAIDNPKEYAIVQHIYNQYIRDSKSQEEIKAAFKKAYPENAAILDYLIKMNARYANELMQFKRSFRNDGDTRLADYLPIRMVPGENASKDQVADIGPDFDGSRGFTHLDKSLPKPIQSANLKRRLSKGVLRAGSKVDYNARRNAMAALSRNLFDARTSPRWAAVRDFLKRPDAADILGGKRNVAYLNEMLGDMYEAQVGLGLLDKTMLGDIADSIATAGKQLASRIGLAGLAQIVQQPADQITNAYMMTSGAGKRIDFAKTMKEVVKAKDNGLIELLSMGSIGERGELLAGLRWSSALDAEMGKLGELLDGGFTQAAKRYLSGMNKKWFAPMRVGDVFSSTTAWVSFYKKYMAERGHELGSWRSEAAKLEDGDMARKGAFAYAEMMTAMTQGPSDPSMFSPWARRGRYGVMNLLKAVGNPFGSFPASMRARLAQAKSEMLRYSRTPTSDPSKQQEVERFEEAKDVMTATAASAAAFEAARLVVVRPLIGLLAGGVGYAIRGIASAIGDDDEEDEYIAETALAASSALIDMLQYGALIDRETQRIFEEADREFRDRRRMGMAFDQEEYDRRRAGQAMKMSIANYLSSMAVGGVAKVIDSQFIDGINRMYYWSEVLEESPNVVKPSGKVIPFDKWLKDTEKTLLVRSGQWTEETDLGPFSVIYSRGTRTMDKILRAAQSRQERADDTAASLSRKDSEVVVEDSRQIRGFVKKMKEAKTESQRKAVTDSFDAWMSSKRVDPKKRQALGKAFIESLRDAETDPWVYVVKGISDSRLRAAAILAKQDGLSQEEVAKLGATLRREGVLTPMVVAQMARLQEEAKALD